MKITLTCRDMEENSYINPPSTYLIYTNNTHKLSYGDLFLSKIDWKYLLGLRKTEWKRAKPATSATYSNDEPINNLTILSCQAYLIEMKKSLIRALIPHCSCNATSFSLTGAIRGCKFLGISNLLFYIYIAKQRHYFDWLMYSTTLSPLRYRKKRFILISVPQFCTDVVPMN